MAEVAVLGDVGLDGSLRATADLGEAARALHEHSVRQVIVPAAALDHPELHVPHLHDLVLLGAHRFEDVIGWLGGDDTALLRHSFPDATGAR